jgi:ABC-2 type transport system permease protein
MLRWNPRLAARVAYWEVVAAWRDRSLQATVAVAVVLILASAWVSWQSHKLMQDQRARYQDLVRDNWLQQPDRHPHRASHYGYLAFRPPGLLSVLDPGVERFSGSSLFLEPHRQNFVNFSEATYSTGLLRFGEMSPSLVLQVLGPLLVIFSGFAIVTRDRQSGTLALLGSQGASMGSLLLGKAAGLCCVAAAPLLAIAAVVAAGAVMAGDAGIDAWLRAGLYLLAHAVYLLFWVAATVTASAILSGSRGALLLLLSLWLAMVVVSPRFLVAAVRESLPTISRADLEASAESGVMEQGDAHAASGEAFARMREQLLRQYGVKRLEDLPVNYNGLVMAKGEEHSSEVFQERFALLRDGFQRQERVLALAALLNPYLAVRQLSSLAAGSDRLHHADFEDAAERYRYQAVQRLNELHTSRIRYENDRGQKVPRAVWEQFPLFVYRAPDVSWALAGNRLAIAAGAVWILWACAALLLADRRARLTER